MAQIWFDHAWPLILNRRHQGVHQNTAEDERADLRRPNSLCTSTLSSPNPRCAFFVFPPPAVRTAKTPTELLGSVLFSLSLNFKQMALYYAPAFFFFLLASCVLRGGGACGNDTGELFFYNLYVGFGSRALAKKGEMVGRRGGGPRRRRRNRRI